MSNYTGSINDIYDKKLKNETAAIEEERRTGLAAANDKLNTATAFYRTRENSLAAERARADKSFNERAASSGIGSGAGTQLRLALDSTAQRAASSLQSEKTKALTEVQTGINDVESRYRADIAEAIGRNDYERAEALLKEYKERDKQTQTDAQRLAKYGDFSGYEQLYGKQTADAMREVWIAQNPALAYNLGLIDYRTYSSIKRK